MPDIVGRLSLVEIRFGVWRYLSALYPTSVNQTAPAGPADPPFGAEVLPYRVDPLFPQQDVDRCLNSALAARFVDLNVNAATIFADEERVDILVGQVDYQLPTDAVYLRGLWYKPRDIRLADCKEEDRIMMHMRDEEDTNLTTRDEEAPTYRRVLNYFVLNETPIYDNPGGVQVRYVKWMRPLILDDQIIESEYAPILQEVIMLDAALQLASRKGGIDTTELARDLGLWDARLNAAAGMSNAPPFRRMTIEHPMRRTRS